MPDFSTRPCYFDLAGGTDLYWSDNFEGSPLGQYYDTTGGSPPSWRSVSNANVGPPSTGINPAICQATTDYIPTATAGNRVMMYNVDNNHGTSSARKRCMLRNMDQQPVTGSFPNNDQLYTGKHYHVQFDLLVPSAYWSGPLYGEPNSNWQTGAMALQWMDYVTDENGKDNPVFTCTVQQATGEFRKLSFASQGNHGGLRFEDYWSQLVPLDEFFTVNMHVYFAGEGVAGSICEAWVTKYEADGLTIAATEQVTNRRGIIAGPDDPWRQTMSMGLYDAGRGYNDALPGEPERRELVNTNWFIGVEGDTQPIFNATPPTRPEVTDFTVPSVSESLTISPITLTATDDVAVTGYQITESSTPPTPADPDWSGTAPTSYEVASEGVAQLYAWAIDADDNVSSETSAICDVRVTNAPKIYKEFDGLTVMEAENHSLNVEKNGYSWDLITDFAGYQGVGAMRSLPTTGVSVILAADAVEDAPEMQFQIESIAGGTRYVWLRALADGNQNSIHVGYPGEVVWDGMSFVGDATWRMTNSTFGDPVCTLTLQPGITTISVWPRELGCVLDRIILTDDPSYTPTGLETESIIQDEPEPGPGEGKTYQEVAGQVVVEAENSVTQIPRGDYSWAETTSYAGYIGAAAIEAVPADPQMQWDAAAAEQTAPEQQYSVVSSGGVRYVWARALRPSGSSQKDSIHFGVNGAIPSTGEALQVYGSGDWSVNNLQFSTGLRISLTLNAGLNTISVFPRENGVVIDRFLLVSDPDFVPTGLESESEILIGFQEFNSLGIAFATTQFQVQASAKTEFNALYIPLQSVSFELVTRVPPPLPPDGPSGQWVDDTDDFVSGEDWEDLDAFI